MQRELERAGTVLAKVADETKTGAERGVHQAMTPELAKFTAALRQLKMDQHFSFVINETKDAKATANEVAAILRQNSRVNGGIGIGIK